TALMRCLAHKPKGFTLAEVLIAVAILAMIGALSYGTLARAISARDRAEEITEFYHDIRQALTRMSREVSMAFLTTHYDCEDPRTQTLFKARSSMGGGRLDFTSF